MISDAAIRSVEVPAEVDRDPETRVVNGLVVFDLSENGELVTSKQVKKLETGEL